MNTAATGPEGLAIFIAEDEPIGSPILYVNEAFVRMSGYTAEQLVGHSALLLAGAKPDRTQLNAARAVVERGRMYVARQRKVRPDGTMYEAEVRLELLGGLKPGAAPRIVLTQREVH